MAESIKEMIKTITQPRRLAKLPARKPSLKAARELLAHVASVGGDIPALLQRAGLPSSAIDLLDEGRKTPIERDHFTRLFAEATWLLDAHECIREGRMPLTKSEIDLLCYCVITCRNLDEVITRTIDFSAMLMPRMSRLTLQKHGTEAQLQMHTIRSARGASAFVSDLTGLATFYRLFAWLIGDDIRPLSAELCYAQMLSAETVARILPCHILYDAPDNSLNFPASYLQKPVIRSYEDLLAFLPHFPFDPDARLTASPPLSERIFQQYAAALADERPLPRTEDFVTDLRLSPATLRRRLADEGQSLRLLRDKARQQSAEHLLRHGDLPLEAIAAQIQFTDVASFSRAFTRWTGQSPGRWRANSRQIGQKVRSN